jgi:hypothetical protein
MKATEITFAMKQGLPNYGSVSAGITYSVEEGEDLDKVFDQARQDVQRHCSVDQSWLGEEALQKAKARTNAIKRALEAKGVNVK